MGAKRRAWSLRVSRVVLYPMELIVGHSSISSSSSKYICCEIIGFIREHLNRRERLSSMIDLPISGSGNFLGYSGSGSCQSDVQGRVSTRVIY